MTTSDSAVVTVPSATQILITRELDAPRHSVYRAYTVPELIRRWWAGHRGQCTSAEIDLRPGGSWRYVMTENAGFEAAFHGEFLEIIDGERIVSTEVFEGEPDAAAVTTTSFAEHDGRTTQSILVQHISHENRDMHLNSGMELGMQEAMNHLEKVARGLA